MLESVAGSLKGIVLVLVSFTTLDDTHAKGVQKEPYMKSIVLLFPGQGSQYVGMGKDLYNQNNIVQQVFEEASDSLKMDMRKLCFESNINEMMKTENAQPAILTISYAAFSVFYE